MATVATIGILFVIGLAFGFGFMAGWSARVIKSSRSDREALKRSAMAAEREVWTVPIIRAVHRDEEALGAVRRAIKREGRRGPW